MSTDEMIKEKDGGIQVGGLFGTHIEAFLPWDAADIADILESTARAEDSKQATERFISLLEGCSDAWLVNASLPLVDKAGLTQELSEADVAAARIEAPGSACDEESVKSQLAALLKDGAELFTRFIYTSRGDGVYTVKLAALKAIVDDGVRDRVLKRIEMFELLEADDDPEETRRFLVPKTLTLSRNGGRIIGEMSDGCAVYNYAPTRFEEVSEISDTIEREENVILDLTHTNREVSRRIVDFLSGCLMMKSGVIKKVCDSVFLLGARNLLYSDQPLSEVFFNASVIQTGETEALEDDDINNSYTRDDFAFLAIWWSFVASALYRLLAFDSFLLGVRVSGGSTAAEIFWGCAVLVPFALFHLLKKRGRNALSVTVIALSGAGVYSMLAALSVLPVFDMAAFGCFAAAAVASAGFYTGYMLSDDIKKKKTAMYIAVGAFVLLLAAYLALSFFLPSLTAVKPAPEPVPFPSLTYNL